MKNSGYKRLFALGAAFSLTLLSACTPQQVRPDTVRLGVALYQQDDTFISTVLQNLEQQAKDEERLRGIQINLNVADGRGSQSTQNEQVDRFLEQGMDVLCINIVDRTAAAVLIDKAQAADVPVIFFNREPVREDLMRWEGAYYVGSQAKEAGRLQGEIVWNAWKEDPSALDFNGDGVLQYLMLEGEPGHQDALLRTEYSIKILTRAGVPMEKLANAAANWQRGQAALRMQQWLEQFPSQAEVIFCNNDDMALGAIDACLSRGLSLEQLPFLVGVDATPPALEAMAAGTLQGTVLNDGAGQSRSILRLACSLAEGEKPEDAVPLTDGKYVWLNYAAVTQKNLAEFQS